MTRRALKLDVDGSQIIRAIRVARDFRRDHPSDLRGMGIRRCAVYCRDGQPALIAYWTKTMLVVRQDDQPSGEEG